MSDRLIGIALGILLGLAIVIGFLFLGSRETIDAPSLSGEETQREQPGTRPGEAPAPP